MAASRMTLCLLGLVVVATAFAAADQAGTAPCTCGGGGGSSLVTLGVDLVVNLQKCKPAVLVEVESVFIGKGWKVCPGGQATSLAPLTLKLAVKNVVTVKVVVLGKRGKPVLEVVLKLDLVQLGVKVVGGRYRLELDLVVDVKLQKLLILCLGAPVCAPIPLGGHGLDLGLGGLP